ncbi:MAG: hypothetical protein B7O98_03960 [Zestosphaera tikiterensis]|uniref:HTH iclR-type domain-containing protein n=1 Tax=Zestosphaera tikiterensis TaxID=1973259 RepID=A0A2R7Y9Q0_9CREN|nr:MAG: hypothetical protein B7O98_03960 [Zestosphaera tikiterensis]
MKECVHSRSIDLKKACLKVLTTALLVLILSLTLQAVFVEGKYSVVSRYILYEDGTAMVTLFVSNIEGENVIYLPLEKGYNQYTLRVLQDSIPSPFNITSDGRLMIEVSGVTSVIVEYEASLGTLINDSIVEVNLNPFTQAVVVLPPNAALLYFSGKPQIDVESNGITNVILSYSEGGSYTIKFVPIPGGATVTSPSKPPTQQTTQAPAGGGMITFLVGGSAIAVAVALLLLFIFLRRRGEPIEPEMHVGLDERDLKLLKILERGEVSLAELAKESGLNKSVVWRRMKRLSDEGLVEQRYEKGKLVFKLTVKGIKKLKELK